MTYLLDTHAFLWFINDDLSLSDTARAIIENPEHAIYLSIASVWEMSIKISLEKLRLPSPFADFIDMQLHQNHFRLLEIKTKHAAMLLTLPFHHRDPFDRMLIAQAQTENMPIISRDAAFDAYDVERYW